MEETLEHPSQVRGRRHQSVSTTGPVGDCSGEAEPQTVARTATFLGSSGLSRCTHCSLRSSPPHTLDPGHSLIAWSRLARRVFLVLARSTPPPPSAYELTNPSVVPNHICHSDSTMPCLRVCCPQCARRTWQSTRIWPRWSHVHPPGDHYGLLPEHYQEDA